jgi:UDP-2,4-diacetamido-2,4,6-trideoxy-beta-L-altropyranose hydrolase
MRIAIRTDSSTDIGTGHLIRCLTLADRLRHEGANVNFICRELPGNQISIARQKGYTVFPLPYDAAQVTGSGNEYIIQHGTMPDMDAKQSAQMIVDNLSRVDWLIVDHYALGDDWEKMLRPYAKNILIIDDLANRSHDCDLLLDQNYYFGFEHRYDRLVPQHCQLFLGPNHSLLRPDFLKAKSQLRHRDGSIERILVLFGGADSSNETAKSMEAIRSLNRPDLKVDVVIGSAYPHRKEIEKLTRNLPNIDLRFNVSHMAALMADADLAIGAGGATTWERCFLGLPAIATILAENQRSIIEATASEGALFNLGWFPDVTAEMVSSKIEWALENPLELVDMSAKAISLMKKSNRQDKLSLVNAIMEFQYADRR